MLVFIPQKKISKTAALEERREGAKVKLRARMVWFSLFSVAIQGIFPSSVSGITVCSL